VLGLIWGIVLIGVWGAALAAAEAGSVVLQAVDISPLAGNRLQLRFQLSGPPKGPPSSFTINEPARIVLDFLDTTNGLSARQQPINVGVADKISVGVLVWTAGFLAVTLAFKIQPPISRISCCSPPCGDIDESSHCWISCGPV